MTSNGATQPIDAPLIVGLGLGLLVLPALSLIDTHRPERIALGLLAVVVAGGTSVLARRVAGPRSLVLIGAMMLVLSAWLLQQVAYPLSVLLIALLVGVGVAWVTPAAQVGRLGAALPVAAGEAAALVGLRLLAGDGVAFAAGAALAVALALAAVRVRLGTPHRGTLRRTWTVASISVVGSLLLT